MKENSTVIQLKGFYATTQQTLGIYVLRYMPRWSHFHMGQFIYNKVNQMANSRPKKDFKESGF